MDLLVWVVAHRQRHVIAARFGAALDREQHRDQLRAHRDEPLGVGLAGDDVQQRHQRAGRRRGVVPQRQLGEFEQFLDPDPGVAQRLDDRPAPEPVVFDGRDVDTPRLDRGSRSAAAARRPDGPDPHPLVVGRLLWLAISGERGAVDDECSACHAASAAAGTAGAALLRRWQRPRTRAAAGSACGCGLASRLFCRRFTFDAARGWARATGQGATQMPQRTGSSWDHSARSR